MIIIIMVAVGIFSYGALQFISTPGFCSNCHQIYPAYESWKRSIHAGITCKDCHNPPGMAGSIKRLYIQLTVFNNPKSQPKAYVENRDLVNKMCTECHSLNRIMAFSDGLYVPHKKHLKEGLMCTTCHSKVVHGKGGEKTRKPEMETCMICHNGERAPEGCGVCHLTLPTPTVDWR